MSVCTNRRNTACPLLLALTAALLLSGCGSDKEYTVDVAVEVALGESASFEPKGNVDVTLSIVTRDSTIHGFTDTDGLVRFSGLMLSQKDSLIITSLNSEERLAVAALTPETPHRVVLRQRFAEPPVAWTLSVRYLDSEQRPIAGQDFLVRSEEGDELMRATTSGRGEWSGEVSVRAGLGIVVECDGMTGAIAADDLPNVEKRKLMFRKQLPVTRTVGIHAYDRRQGDLGGLKVQAFRGQSRTAEAETDARGRASLVLSGMPGTEFSIRCEDFAEPQTIRMEKDGPENLNLQFHRVPEVEGGYTVHVKHRNKGGREIALKGARVDIRRGGRQILRGESDRQGDFSYSDRHPYRAQIEFSAALNDYQLRSPVVIEHQEGIQNVDLFMVYAPDTTTVTFRFRDADSGQAIREGHARLNGGPDHYIKSESPGVLKFGGVHRKYQSSLRLIAGPVIKTFEFSPAVDGKRDYTLQISQSGEINLYVHGAESRNAKIAGAQIYAVESGVQGRLLGTTGADGHVKLREKYGLTRYFIDPMTPLYAGVASEEFVFNQEGQTLDIAVPKGDPLEECRRCIAELNTSVDGAGGQEEIDRRIRSLLIRCPAENYSTESPQTKVELWQDAVVAMNNVASKSSGAVSIQEAQSVLDMLEVHNLPNAERCIYYAFRSWLLVTLLKNDVNNTALIEQSLEDLGYANEYFDDLEIRRRNYSTCIKAYLEYLQGRTKFYKSELLQNQGMPDEALTRSSRVHMETYLHYINGNNECDWPASWRQQADYVIGVVNGMGY